MCLVKKSLIVVISILFIAAGVSVLATARAADAGGPYTGNEGSAIAISGSSTGFVNPVYKWDLDHDGLYDDATGPNTSYTWNDNGTYTIGLEVVESQTPSITAYDTATVTVNNVAPTVTAPADTSGDEGSSITPGNASFTDPGTVDTHTATVNWGDGSTDNLGTVTSPFALGSHTYADNGSYTVTVTVTDKDGGVGSDTFTITVNNVAPTVTAPADTSGDEGSSITPGNASFTDPGTVDTHTATVNWGDGSTDNLGTVTSPFALGSHTYADNGSYTVTVTVTDKDGGVGSDTFTITVNNVPPTLGAIGAQNVNEGATLVVPLSATDPSPVDVLTFSVTGLPAFGSLVDNGNRTGKLTFTPGYRDSGTYNVTVTVVDDDGGTDSETFVLTVIDPIPPVSALTPANSFGWYKTNPTINATDDPGGAGIVASLHYKLDSSSEVTVAGHTTVVPIGEGTHTLRYWAVDDAGNIEAAHTVTVRMDKTPPVITISVPSFTGHFEKGAVVRSEWNAHDALSGIDIATAPAFVDTANSGEREFVAHATDKAGNETTARVTYFVVFRPIGIEKYPYMTWVAPGMPGKLPPPEWECSPSKSLPTPKKPEGLLRPLKLVKGQHLPIIFGLEDASGHPVTNAAISFSIAKVTKEGCSIIAPPLLGLFSYDTDRQLYYLFINNKPYYDTANLEPGKYRLWIGLGDGTQLILAFEVTE